MNASVPEPPVRHITLPLALSHGLLIVGDIHGCKLELQSLIQTHRTSAEQTLLFVGDLVNKGPDSAGVIQYIRTLPNCFAVRGNHDEAALKWILTTRRLEFEDTFNTFSDADADGVTTPAATDSGYGSAKPAAVPVPSKYEWTQSPTLTPADVSWLLALPYTITIPIQADSSGGVSDGSASGDGDSASSLGSDSVPAQIVIVHAGLTDSPSLETMETSQLTTMREWGQQYQGRHGFAVFGHDAKRGLQQHRYALGLDTGCVYGRTLTAAIISVRDSNSISVSDNISSSVSDSVSVRVGASELRYQVVNVDAFDAYSKFEGQS